MMGRREEFLKTDDCVQQMLTISIKLDINICHLLGALVWEIVFLGVLGLAQGYVYRR